MVEPGGRRRKRGLGGGLWCWGRRNGAPSEVRGQRFEIARRESFVERVNVGAKISASAFPPNWRHFFEVSWRGWRKGGWEVRRLRMREAFWMQLYKMSASISAGTEFQ
eukprot:326417-Chlamydomonas_euryale.AAC.1